MSILLVFGLSKGLKSEIKSKFSLIIYYLSVPVSYTHVSTIKIICVLPYCLIEKENKKEQLRLELPTAAWKPECTLAPSQNVHWQCNQDPCSSFWVSLQIPSMCPPERDSAAQVITSLWSTFFIPLQLSNFPYFIILFLFDISAIKSTASLFIHEMLHKLTMDLEQK